LGDAFNETPELATIQQLFEKAYLGLSFSGNTKQAVSAKLSSCEA
jgi:hypothetical protein